MYPWHAKIERSHERTSQDVVKWTKSYRRAIHEWINKFKSKYSQYPTQLTNRSWLLNIGIFNFFVPFVPAHWLLPPCLVFLQDLVARNSSPGLWGLDLLSKRSDPQSDEALGVPGCTFRREERRNCTHQPKGKDYKTTHEDIYFHRGKMHE